MSHLATVEAQIKDLDAVEAACKEMGWTLHRGQTQFKMWYDDQFEKCDHAISIPGNFNGMELGLVKQDDGTFRLHHDDLIEDELEKRMTADNGFCGFLPQYEAAVTRKFLMRKGIRFTEKQEGNKFVFQGVVN